MGLGYCQLGAAGPLLPRLREYKAKKDSLSGSEREREKSGPVGFSGT